MLNFKIIKRLGSSNQRKFNEVFLVELPLNQGFGVLKTIKKDSKNEIQQAVLRNENRFRFDWNGFSKILDFDENEDEIRLLKKFIEGKTLIEFWKDLKNKDRFPFLLRFLEQISPIFEVLKANGIVHGDIKPTNFIISGDLDFFKVTLIDFGLAFFPHEYQNKMAGRKLIFSLGFSAPELVLNRMYLANSQTDLYALGITIYYLYENKLPLTHSNPAIMTNLNLVYPIIRPAIIPKSVFSVIEKMCVKFAFKKPPHLLPIQEVDDLLFQALSERSNSIEEIIKNLNETWTKKSIFSKIFSRN